VEGNKEGDGFVRFRWEETKEQDAVGGARLTIEIGADFPIGPIAAALASIAASSWACVERHRFLVSPRIAKQLVPPAVEHIGAMIIDVTDPKFKVTT
jgi:hypothetical protein